LATEMMEDMMAASLRGRRLGRGGWNLPGGAGQRSPEIGMPLRGCN
jgi:hypothetical protein